MNSLALRRAELHDLDGATKIGSVHKFIVDVDSFRPFERRTMPAAPDLIDDFDSLLSWRMTVNDARGFSTGALTLWSLDQPQPGLSSLAAHLAHWDGQNNSADNLIEHSRLDRDVANVLPPSLVSAMADLVATYEQKATLIFHRNSNNNMAFASPSGSSNNYFYEMDDNTSPMDGHGAWVVSGSGLPAHDFLHGMSTFESPMSEMLEGDFSDDVDFDAFLEEELARGFNQGVAHTHTHTDMSNLGAFDFNTPVVPTPDFNDPLLFPIVDENLGLGYPPCDFDLPVAESFFAPLSIGDASSYTNSPFAHSSNSASPFTTTSPGSTNESDTSGHAYHCTTDGCSKTFKKESQLKQHQRVHKKSLACPHCPAPKFAQVRDLERHLQVRHKDVAVRENVRSETRQCPFEGCAHRGRRDNVSRHYESKHGGKLQWRKGVPTVIPV
ncbi:hypothetical protein ACHAQA_004542 [Verticillium albo-atrum]